MISEDMITILYVQQHRRNNYNKITGQSTTHSSVSGHNVHITQFIHTRLLSILAWYEEKNIQIVLHSRIKLQRVFRRRRFDRCYMEKTEGAQYRGNIPQSTTNTAQHVYDIPSNPSCEVLIAKGTQLYSIQLSLICPFHT